AMCGKAYDPRFIIAWPTARYAVMGAAQASDTVFSILARARERGDKKTNHEELEELRAKVKQSYEEQTDIRYGAARGWVDAISQTHLITIAAVHGAAVAGGAGIMSACDFVVAAQGTKIGYPEVRRGLVAGLVMSFLRRQVGERNMRELLLGSELIDAERAREI